jgi:iron(III) transport system ATP-binding protein
MRQLTLTGLHKAFGSNPVLQGVNLAVQAGAFTAILGPSGSGKTTLLRVLAGFERADAGTVTIGERVVDGQGCYVPPEHRKIGYVPQEGALFPHLTVAGNVGFGLRAKDRRGSRIPELLESVGLAGMGDRYPHQLSGGQQQRVALARALAVRPEVVLLDEPFNSLDAHLRSSVRADVHDICRAAGITAVLVTHDQDEALSMADRIAVLREGRIIQYDAPHQLYGRPVDPALARFVGDANLLAGQLGDAAAPGMVRTALGLLRVDPHAVPGPVSGQVTVLIRPEQLELLPSSAAHAHVADGAGMADPPRVPGTFHGHVVGYEYYGHDAVVRIRPDGAAADIEVAVRIAGGPQVAVGGPVTIRANGPVVVWNDGA